MKKSHLLGAMCASIISIISISPHSAEASLIGDTVGCLTVAVPSLGTDCAATATVGASEEFEIGFGPAFLIGIDIGAESILFDISAGFSGTHTLGDLEVTLNDLDWVDSPGTLVGFTLVNAGVGNLDATDISFTADSITVDLSGTEWETFNSDSFTIDLATEHTIVPIPAAALLFGSGLLGLIGIARRKKAA